jgi:hypothetical protein
MALTVEDECHTFLSPAEPSVRGLLQAVGNRGRCQLETRNSHRRGPLHEYVIYIPERSNFCGCAAQTAQGMQCIYRTLD